MELANSRNAYVYRLIHLLQDVHDIKEIYLATDVLAKSWLVDGVRDALYDIACEDPFGKDGSYASLILLFSQIKACPGLSGPQEDVSRES